jgi:hypothetical protein
MTYWQKRPNLDLMAICWSGRLPTVQVKVKLIESLSHWAAFTELLLEVGDPFWSLLAKRPKVPRQMTLSVPFGKKAKSATSDDFELASRLQYQLNSEGVVTRHGANGANGREWLRQMTLEETQETLGVRTKK